MAYMLDTDICSYVIRERPASVARQFREHAGELCVSAITACELWYGAFKAGSDRVNKAVQGFLERIYIEPFPESGAHVYGDLRARLEKAGHPIGAMDMLIAAHAAAQGHTLVTNNTRHFARLGVAKLANWASARQT